MSNKAWRIVALKIQGVGILIAILVSIFKIKKD